MIKGVHVGGGGHRSGQVVDTLKIVNLTNK